MHTIEIPEIKLKKYLPADLSECDSQQYIDMCELIFYYQNQTLTYDELRTHAVYKLLNMKPSNTPGDNEEKFSNIYQISELIDSFFEKNNQQTTIKQYYTHNPVPSFKPLLKTFYGPSNNFMNMTFGEYTDALRLFYDFHAIGDIKILSLITAIFYRPKKNFLFIQKLQSNYDGDIRIPYKSNQLDSNVKNFKNAPIGFVYGFYLLFASFQKYIVEAKIIWGGKTIDFSILFQSNPSSETETNPNPDIGMDAIAFSIAESGTFGTLEQVRNTNFWQIMIRMYDLRITDLQRQKTEKDATDR